MLLSIIKTTLSGYRSLSIKAVAATFLTIGGLFSISLIVLFIEIVFARFSQKIVDQSRKIDKSQELQIITNDFSLKLAFRNKDVLKEYLRIIQQSHLNVCANFADSISIVGYEVYEVEV
jgi:hypothetical protein